MNCKNYKHLIQSVIEGKVILKKDGILKGLQVLVVVIIFIFENQKDCLMKIIQLLLQVTIASIHN